MPDINDWKNENEENIMRSYSGICDELIGMDEYNGNMMRPSSDISDELIGMNENDKSIMRSSSCISDEDDENFWILPSDFSLTSYIQSLEQLSEEVYDRQFTSSAEESSGTLGYISTQQVCRNDILTSNSVPVLQQTSEYHDTSNENLDIASFSDCEDLYDFISEALSSKVSDDNHLPGHNDDIRKTPTSDDITLESGSITNNVLEGITPFQSTEQEFVTENEKLLNKEGSMLVGGFERGMVSKWRERHEETPLQNVSYCLVNDKFKRAKFQIEVFIMRLKMTSIAFNLSSSQDYHHDMSKLITYMENITSSASESQFTGGIAKFTSDLKFDLALSNLFLYHFISYVHSTLDLEANLYDINDFLEYFLAAADAVVNGRLERKVLEDIKTRGIVQKLLESLSDLVSEETKYSTSTIESIIRCKKKSTIKAHMVRMHPRDSQKLFQETFSADLGNPSDTYVIYIWRILKLYSLDETDVKEFSVVCLSDTLKESGEFVDIVPLKELRGRETKIPLSQIRGNMSPAVSNNTKMIGPSHSSPDINFEWVDLKVGQVYENGVVFLTNMNDWLHRLLEIATEIENLEVKKYIKFVPALGTTYGFQIQNELQLSDIRERVPYIRVRVVRVRGPIACVYGIDTGSVFICETSHLFLLSSTLVSLKPCGRLAQFPFVPAPNGENMVLSLKLLVLLASRGIIMEHLSSINIRDLTVWIQVDCLTNLTLDLLGIIVKTDPNSSCVPDICLLLTDYLVHLIALRSIEKTCVDKAISVLLRAMESSDDVRLLLAKHGAFISLCDLGLELDDEGVWNSLQMLLGGKDAMDSILSVLRKMSNHGHKKYSKTGKMGCKHLKLLGREIADDISPSVIRIAAMPKFDRNWDIEVRNTIDRPNYVSYHDRGGWKWKKEEVLLADIAELHYGHQMNVKNDETHHIILDKSIPNIRMNTLLQ
ncbi:hypothetical protein SK128_022282, partial [Halocaridina rubra]